MTTTPTSRIEILTDCNRVNRKKPRALKPYMTDEVWEYFCNDLDDAMKPWVALTQTASRIARALGGLFLVFAIAYTTVKLSNLTANEIDMTAFVLFPMLMLVVVGATCWLLRVLPQTDNLVMERIERVLEGATQQINEHMQQTAISMEYQEDEVHTDNGKSVKWIQIRILNEHGENILTGDEDDDDDEDATDHSENDGGFMLV